MTTKVTNGDLLAAIMAQTAAISSLATAIQSSMVGSKPEASNVVVLKQSKTAKVATKVASSPLKGKFEARLLNATAYAKASNRTMGIWAITKSDGTTNIYNYGYDKKPSEKAAGNERLLATVTPSGKVTKFA